jgi:glycosyltransferase involved in cell wall biosynthesis
MRILVIHTVYQFRGGEDSVVANEVELLRSAGHQVELLQFNNSGRAIFKLLQLPFNISAYLKTKRQARAFKPDVAHIHNLHFAGSNAVLYALKRLRIPAVMTLHNYRLLCPSATLFYQGKLFLASLNQSFCRQAIKNGVYQHSRLITFWLSLSMWLHQCLGTFRQPATYIALGEYTRSIFAGSKMAAITDRIIVKPNFCFPAPPYEKKKRGYYLYVGRLSEEKGVQVLLDAFAQHDLPLIIAGTGPLEMIVAAAAEKHPNISYLNEVDKNEVNGLLAGAKALIFPSVWYETFGMVIVEAFAAGTPVIASDIGQLNYTITHGHNGLHFETGSQEQLNQTLRYFEKLSAKELAAYQQNALATYRTHYDPENNLAQLEAIYQSAAKKA